MTQNSSVSDSILIWGTDGVRAGTSAKTIVFCNIAFMSYSCCSDIFHLNETVCKGVSQNVSVFTNTANRPTARVGGMSAVHLRAVGTQLGDSVPSFGSHFHFIITVARVTPLKEGDQPLIILIVFYFSVLEIKPSTLFTHITELHSQPFLFGDRSTKIT